MPLDIRRAVCEEPNGDKPVFILCPEHNDTGKPNLAVFADGIHCFACGFSVPRTMDALAYLLHMDREHAVEVASRYEVDHLPEHRRETMDDLPPLPAALADIYHEMLCGRNVVDEGGVMTNLHVRGPREQRRDWLHARGLNDRAISEAKLGHDGVRFVIPIFDRDGQLLTLRYRRDDKYLDTKRYPKYSGTTGRNGLFLYPMPCLARLMGFDDTLFVCEGEFDALRLWQEGLPAVTLTNGAGQVVKLPEILREKLPGVKRLIVCTDQDEAGNDAANALIDTTPDYEVTRLTWDEGKDVSEYLTRTNNDTRLFRRCLRRRAIA